MTLLEELIGGASAEATSTESLLMKAVVLGRRLRSAKLEQWARSELKGYDPMNPESLPKYRGPIIVQATGYYSGPAGSGGEWPISPGSAPDDAEREALFTLRLHQPVSELEELSKPREDSRVPTVEWPAHNVYMWDQLSEAGKVPHPQYMRLYAAVQKLPQSFIRGILSSIRTSLLDLALDLQDASPGAGEFGGPTVAESGEIERAVTHITANIFGTGNTVSLGSGPIDQSVTVVGDVDSLISAARATNVLDERGVEELREAASAPQVDRRNRLRAFLDRVASGAINVSSSVAENVATDQLENLVDQFLGGTS